MRVLVAQLKGCYEMPTAALFRKRTLSTPSSALTKPNYNRCERSSLPDIERLMKGTGLTLYSIIECNHGRQHRGRADNKAD